MKTNSLIIISVTWFFLVVSQISGFSQNNEINNAHKLRIKVTNKASLLLKDSPNKIISLKGSYVSLKNASFTKLNKKFQAKEFKKVFIPQRNTLTKKHQSAGIDSWYEITLNEIVTPELIKEYQNDPDILIAEPIYTKQLIGTNNATIVNDTRYNNQWHYENTGQTGGKTDADIDLSEAWFKETGKPNVTIAVIDGGIDVNHEDLEQSMWVNYAEYNGILGTDDDHNGYIDDIYGYNFGDQTGKIFPGNHATHVSGIIGAIRNNGIGISGIAGGNGNNKGVRLMSCQTFGENNTDGFAEALVYAADNGAVIAQNSWGYVSPGVYEQCVLDAIDYFIANAGKDDNGNQIGPMDGGIVIFAAGNNNSNKEWYPACYEPVIAVASTNHKDEKAWYSNYGSWIDITAPGGETNVNEQGILSTLTSNNYGYMQGTSMACPHVSGVAALIISKYGKQGFTSSQLRNNLLNSADNINSLNNSYLGNLGAGRLNANNALQENINNPSGNENNSTAEIIAAASPILSVTPKQITDRLFSGNKSNHNLSISNSATTGSGNLQFNIGIETVETTAASKIQTNSYPSTYNIPENSTYEQNRVIVRFKKGIQTSAVNTLKAELKANVLKKYDFIDAELWSVTNYSVADAVKMYHSDPRILYIEPDYKLNAIKTPNDPMYTNLWGMHNIGQTGGSADADIDAAEAWEQGTGGNVVVGVIDTGVDYTHEDLSANMWKNPNEIPGNGIDDDTNGYIDDVYGWDFVNEDNDPMDDKGHGSHCAGTIAGVGNNGKGVVGVCWKAKIMALKFLDANGSGNTSDAIEAIQYAVKNKANLTSNSWGGGGYSSAMRDAILAANTVNQLFIAAAGNSGTDNDLTPHYPSSYDCDNIISVAATDHNDNLASFSCYGKTSVDIAAPGVNILSTTPSNNYSTYSGTSMATPHVSGAVALLWSKVPYLSNMQVKNAILDNVDLKTALSSKIVTGGRLNINNVLKNNIGWISVDTTSGNLVPGGSKNINVSLNAENLIAGTYRANIIILSNDPVNIDDTIPVEMIVDGSPKLSISIDSLTFNHYVGYSVTDSIIISNTGTDTLKISGISSDNIAFTPLHTKSIILPGEQKSLSVRFLPTIPGKITGILTILSNDTSNPSAKLILEGNAILPPNIKVTPTAFEINLFTGDSISKNLTINNTGNSNLYFDIKLSDSAPYSYSSNKISAILALNPGITDYQINGNQVTYKIEEYVMNDETVEKVNSTFSSIVSNSLEGLVIVAPTTLNMFATQLRLNGARVHLIESLISPNILDTTNVLIAWDGFIPTDFTDEVNSWIKAGGNLIIDGDQDLANYDNLIQGSGIHYSSSPSSSSITKNIFPHDVTDTITHYYIGAGSLASLTVTTPSVELIRDILGKTFAAACELEKGKIVALCDETLYSNNTNQQLLGINAVKWFSGSTNWLKINPSKGNISSGGNTTIKITFDANNLTGGDYKKTISVNSNDPATPVVNVPVVIHVTGIPNIVLSNDTLAFDAFVGYPTPDTLIISNTGTDSLIVKDIISDNSAFVPAAKSFTIAPKTKKALLVNFLPTSPGIFKANLTINSNDSGSLSVNVVMIGKAAMPPVLSVTPKSFDEILLSGDSVSKNITVSNNGSSNLLWKLTCVNDTSETKLFRQYKHLLRVTEGGPNSPGNNTSKMVISPISINTINQLSGKTKILAWVTYSDMLREYPNTMNAISQYYTDYTVTTTTTSIADSLAAELSDKNVFLIPEQESGSTSIFMSLGASWSAVLNRFVENGGTIILCGSYVGAHELLNSSGLMNMSFSSVYNSGTMNVNDTNHFITSGLSNTIPIMNATFFCNITDPQASLLVQYLGNTAIAAKEKGLGKIVYIGYDYYEYDNNAARIISNAVKWDHKSNWLEVNPKSGSLAAGFSQSLQVKLNAQGLNEGDYYAKIILNSNDPATPTDSIPVHLYVNGAPNISLLTDTLSFQSYVGFVKQDTLMVSNTGTDTLKITNISIDNNVFSTPTNTLSIAPAGKKPLVINFLPNSTGNFDATLTITSNDSSNITSLVKLLGKGVTPPVINISPISINEKMFSGDTLTRYLTIANTGGSELTFNLTVKDSAKSQLSFEKITQILNKNNSITNYQINGNKITYNVQGEYRNEQTINNVFKTCNTTLSRNLEGMVVIAPSLSGSLITELQLRGARVHYVSYLYSGILDTVDVIIVRDGMISSDLTGQINAWIKNGGNIIIDADNDQSVYNSIISGSGIEYTTTFCSYGITSNIYPHAITDTISRYYIGSSAQASLIVASPAVELIRDINGKKFAAACKLGEGKILALCDETLDGYYDNQLQLGLNAFDWFTDSKDWLKVNPLSGTIAAGSSTKVNVFLNTTGLLSGSYYKNIYVNSNDPAKSNIKVPVTIDVTGIANISLSSDSLNFDSYVGYPSHDTLIISNIGTDTLKISNIFSDNSAFSPSLNSLAIAPGGKHALSVAFLSTIAGNTQGNLTINSNDSANLSVKIVLLGTSVLPPHLSISPSSIDEKLFTGDTLTRNLTITNTGNSPLIWNASVKNDTSETKLFREYKHLLNYTIGDFNSGNTPGEKIVAPIPIKSINQLAGKTKILAWVTYSDMYTEYPNTMNAISQYYTDYTVTTTTTSAAVSLAAELSDKDVFLIPEQEGGNTSVFISLGTEWKNILNNFINKGGTIILCGSDLGAHELFNSSGLMSMSYNNTIYGSGTMTVLNNSHFITKELGNIISIMNATTFCNITDPEVSKLVQYNGYTSVAAKQKGLGKIIYIGYDFFAYDNDAARIISNAVKWGGDAKWLNINPTTGTVASGLTQTISVKLNATGLNKGNYYANVILTSNDPASPVDSVPVHLFVDGAPNIDLSADTLHFYTKVGIPVHDTLVISNTGTDTLKINNIISGNPIFTSTVKTLAIAPGNKNSVIIRFLPTSAGSYNTNLTISSNDSSNLSVKVALFGISVTPPVISVSPKSFDENMLSGDTLTRLLTITNTGGSDLDFNITMKDTLSSSFTAKEISKILSENDKIINYQINGNRVSYTIRDEVVNEQTTTSVNKTFNTTLSKDLEGIIVATPSYLSTFATQLQLRGARVHLMTSFFTGLLDSIDVLVIRDGTIPFEYADEINSWIKAGGNLIIDADNDQSIFNGIIVGSGIQYTTTYCSYGITSNIYRHAVTDTITKYYIGSSAQASLVLTQPAVELISDITGKKFAAACVMGNGKIVALCDETLTSININQLQLGLNAVDWFAGSSEWLNTNPIKGTVAKGASTNVKVMFNAKGLTTGNYSKTIMVSSNDPVQPIVKVPATIHVTGVPSIAISKDSLFFSAYAGIADLDTVIISNTGTDTLKISNIVADNNFFRPSVTKATIIPGAKFPVIITFLANTAGTFNATLTITCNDPKRLSAKVILHGNSIIPPTMSVTPKSFDVELKTGETTVKPLYITNNGGSSLYWKGSFIDYDTAETKLYGQYKHLLRYADEDPDNTINNTGLKVIAPISMSSINQLAGNTKILVWVTYSDMYTEYPNTMNAISQYYADYTVTTTTTTSATTLAAELSDKNVFLIPEQESGSSSTFASLGVAWSAVLNNFVNSGGTIILCGSGYGAHEIFNSGNLMNISYTTVYNSGFMNVNDTSHYITKGLATAISIMNATFFGSITDPGASNLVQYNGYTSVAVKEKGLGKIVYIGYDFYAYDNDAARIISNAVKWTSQSPKWLNINPISGATGAKSTQAVNLTFNATGLNNGDYFTKLIISGNAPVNPSDTVIIHLKVKNYVNIDPISSDPIIKVFPNPTPGELNIEFSGNKEGLIVQLSALNGKILIDKQFKPNYQGIYQLNISRVPDGEYILTVKSGNTMKSEKIILKR